MKEKVVYLNFEYYEKAGDNIQAFFRYARQGYKYCRSFEDGGTFTEHVLSTRPLTHAEARSVVRHIWSHGSNKPHPKFTIL